MSITQGLQEVKTEEIIGLALSIFRGEIGPGGADGARVTERDTSAPTGADRLELECSKVTQTCLRLVSHRCRSRCCPRCGPGIGVATRQRLLSAAHVFRSPQLLSMTVDRKGYDSPEAAFDDVSRNKYIARLMRDLGVIHWVRVLEFQEESGDGWPHWHILIDAADLPGGRLTKADLRRVWSLWRDKWGVGGFHASLRSGGFQNATHALMYITKYLIKSPRRGYPEWVLERQRVRFFDMSSAMRKVLRVVVSRSDAEEVESATDAAEDEVIRHRDPDRPIFERVAECGHLVHVVEETTDGESGAVRCEYRGTVAIGRDALMSLSATGHLPFGLREEVDRRLYIEGTATAEMVVDFLERLANHPAVRQVEGDMTETRQALILAQWSMWDGGTNELGDSDDGREIAEASHVLAGSGKVGEFEGVEFSGDSSGSFALPGLVGQGQCDIGGGA